jgi:hypothetical protein
LDSVDTLLLTESGMGSRLLVDGGREGIHDNSRTAARHSRPVFDLDSSLTVDTGGATPARHTVSTGAALNVPLLSGLLPEPQGGDAGDETSQEIVAAARLAQALGVGVDLAGHAPHAAATSAAVGARTAEMLVELVGRHAGLYHSSWDLRKKKEVTQRLYVMNFKNERVTKQDG